MSSWDFIFDQDLRFWATVTVASMLKWLFTPETKQQTRKQATAGIVAGAACAFYGSDYILSKFSIATGDRDIVVIGLVFTGEHIVRTLFNLGPLFARKVMGISEKEFQEYDQKQGEDDAR